MSLFMGIDTSNYTTSIGVVDENNNIVLDMRRCLDVGTGQKGLRQSEAFFQHCNNFPQMYIDLTSCLDIKNIKAVGVSTQPRFKEGSYMPVFRAGENYAKIITQTLQIPLIECSHQEGHIYAGMISQAIKPPFIALHLSGGTTDLMLVKATKGYRLDIINLASSRDLHCGQFVDRLGVKMGLGFPAGAQLDRLSREIATTNIVIPSSVKDGNPSFSGPLTKALYYLEKGELKGEVALASFKCIAKTVEKMLNYAISKVGTQKIIVVGGVGANTYIRSFLEKKFQEHIYFADSKLSCDNSIGVASMARAFGEND